MFPGKGYHGTGAKFSEFDLSKGSDIPGSLVGKLGVSEADEPGMAELSASLAARKDGAANILPLRYDPGKSGTVTLDQAKSLPWMAACLLPCAKTTGAKVLFG
jgi:hypothetical protein